MGLVPGGILGLKKEKESRVSYWGNAGEPFGRWAHEDSTEPGTFAGPEGGPFGVRVSI